MNHSLIETSRLQDSADALLAQPLAEQARLLAERPPRGSAAVFEYLPFTAQRALTEEMPPPQVGALLNAMAPDDRTRFLGALPVDERERLIALLNDEERTEAEMLLQYPPDSVGRLMTPHYVAVHQGSTVREVLDYIRAHGRNSETLNVVYVIDDRGVLIDDFHIRELLVVPAETRIADIMDRRY